MNRQAAPPSPASIESLENDVVALFVDLVRWFGAPKSVGAIYGLLFISKKPLSFDQIAQRLDMSSGSVSQGLRLLKAVGAVRITVVPRERRDFYLAEISLRKLAAIFLTFQLHEKIANGEERVKALLTISRRSAFAGQDSLKFMIDRMERLYRWHSQAKAGLPLIEKLLES